MTAAATAACSSISRNSTKLPATAAPVEATASSGHSSRAISRPSSYAALTIAALAAAAAAS
eukprot:5766981-Alexandrium_andersonii.AAC.1